MRKSWPASLVACLAFVAVIAPSASQAYPGSTCNVSDVSVVGGVDATVVAAVSPAVASDFEVTYGDQVHTENGVTSTTATFDTSEVDERTETTVFVTVDQAGGSVPCSGTITLLPQDDDDGGDDGDGGGILPNTGGERLLWLLIGAALLVVGAGALMTTRRRHVHYV